MQKLSGVTEAAYLAFCLQPPAENAALFNLPEGTKTYDGLRQNQNQHRSELVER